MLAICYNLGCVSAGLSGQFILDSQGGNCSPACAIRADKDWARSQEEGNTQPLGQGFSAHITSGGCLDTVGS